MWTEAKDNANNNVMEGTLSVGLADISSSTLLDRISVKVSVTVGLHVTWMRKKKKNLLNSYWDMQKLAVQKCKGSKSIGQ